MKGKVYLVGIGSGIREDMTYGAASVLKKADVVIGQKSCLDMLWKSLVGVEIIAADMSPVERSKAAAEVALAGRNAAIVSTGDTGIYAIASTFFSYLKDNNIELDVEVVPGVTLASTAAARLGSPLGHDFAVISLADQATGWDDIKKRLEAAAEADFVIVLYNPVGKLGYERLKETVAILLKHRQADTPLGAVTAASTSREKVLITTLGEVSDCNIDKDTLLIIGNSETFVYNNRLITPRGYIEGVGY
jgi:precorrin-3B C17-methyltransferase